MCTNASSGNKNVRMADDTVTGTPVLLYTPCTRKLAASALGTPLHTLHTHTCFPHEQLTSCND